MKMPGNRKNPVLDFVIDSLDRYPKSELCDIYKLLYHAYHGAEHAVANSKTAEEWFIKEWELVKPIHPDEQHPVLEPIFIDGVTPRLYRLHLAPAKSIGLDRGKILVEFLRTAGEFPDSYPGEEIDLHVAFQQAWTEVRRGISTGRISYSIEEYDKFITLIERNKWPVVHHSDVFRNAYDPHYRLIMDPDEIGIVDTTGT